MCRNSLRFSRTRLPTLVLCRTQFTGVNRLSMTFGLFSIARLKNLTMP